VSCCVDFISRMKVVYCAPFSSTAVTFGGPVGVAAGDGACASAAGASARARNTAKRMPADAIIVAQRALMRLDGEE
jgi:hypothetical protein